MPRRDNANGARAKIRSPVNDPDDSAGLVRLYSDYMYDEYGEFDSDYVFVNLWAEPYRRGRCTTRRCTSWSAGSAPAPASSSRLHMLRHTHATDLIRPGVAIEVVARLLTHRSSTTTSQTYVHLDVADVRAELHRAGVWAQAEVGRDVDRRSSPSARPRPTALAGRRPTPRLEYAKDTLAGAASSGSPPAGAARSARFAGIDQAWLREATKRWSPVPAGHRLRVQHDRRRRPDPWPGSRCSSPQHPEVAGFPASPATLLERLSSSWLAAHAAWSTNTRAPLADLRRCCSTGATATAGCPASPPTPSSTKKRSAGPPTSLPRFIPEFVMGQLETDANLGPARNPTIRHLVVLLMETGLRGGDAVRPAVQPDPRRQRRLALPALHNAKIARRTAHPPQRQGGRRDPQPNKPTYAMTWPDGSPWLFPGIRHNPDGCPTPTAPARASSAMAEATSDCTTRPASPSTSPRTSSATPLGTRLINAGVPQHVIQRCSATPARG